MASEGNKNSTRSASTYTSGESSPPQRIPVDDLLWPTKYVIGILLFIIPVVWVFSIWYHADELNDRVSPLNEKMIKIEAQVGCLITLIASTSAQINDNCTE